MDNFKIFKSALGQFIANRPLKHEILSNKMFKNLTYIFVNYDKMFFA